MPVRRLKPFRVVITGVENSGKTTLAEHLSKALEWPWIKEAARFDPAVIENRVQPTDLRRLLNTFQETFSSKDTVLFDTGPMVLNIWSKSLFGIELDGAEEAIAQVDLFLFCRTLPQWEEDPLRSLPQLEERLVLEQQYHSALVNCRRPWCNLPALPMDERLSLAETAIKSHCQP